MGLHLILNLQEAAVGSGSLNASLLALQGILLWTVSAGVLVLALRRQRA
ncbi:MAG: hypothetical protein K0R03_1275 [Moraxellaceae bacterium]|jgi:hypothetical protein|nr:hypothetical protein [Moraxellaceae bacterium]MDF3030717.1 hypothetical protein [Moraxellaceae bacterium]